MNSKLINIGVGLLSAGIIGILFAVVLEIQLKEPIYYIVMKIAAGVFGVGGPILGLGIARKGKTRRK